jgi:hypothetical protein
VLVVRPAALLGFHLRAKLWRPKEVATQGHIRKRAPSGSWEYILDVGRYGAQRCQGCGAALLDRTAAQGELSGLWRAAA